jgi:hypothetical protein
VPVTDQACGHRAADRTTAKEDVPHSAQRYIMPAWLWNVTNPPDHYITVKPARS